jgi:chemotaxis protein histidine kinase CheA
MTLVKVEGVSSEVFIPDQISDDDKLFLVQSTENIVQTVIDAKLKIGRQLNKVRDRFIAAREFNGANGWFQAWYKSIGLNASKVAEYTNIADIIDRSGCPDEIAETIKPSLARLLGTPSLGTAQYKDIQASGASTELIKCYISSEGGIDSGASVATAKKSDLNQILVLEELVTSLQTKLRLAEEAQATGPKRSRTDKEANAEAANNGHRVSLAEKSLAEAKRRLESLADEKAALEAKYGGDNWRNEENIRKEFEAAIAKARTEEQAKKAKPVVPDTSEQDALKAQYEALLSENQKLNSQLASKEQSIERLLESTKKVEKKLEHAKGATREWENYNTTRTRGLVKAYISHFWEGSAMLGYCRKYPETTGGMGDEFVASVEQLEDLAIDAMIAWLPYLPAGKLDALLDALGERGELAPVETIDSRELTIINV